MSRFASGDVDVLLAAEQAEVRRPAQDERTGRAADSKADADRSIGGAVVELFAGPGLAAGGIRHQARSVPAGIDELKIFGRGMRRRTRISELDLHGDKVSVDVDVRQPEREALNIGTRAR